MVKINTAGRHPAIVTAAEFGESEKGTPYVSITFGGDGENSEGTMTGYLYLSEKCIETVDEFGKKKPGPSLKTLRDAFGFDGNFETLIEQITGKPCSITNEEEEYEGKERVKVKWINAPRSSKPIEDQASFLKTLSAKAARIPVKAPVAPAPTRTPPPKAAPAPAKSAAPAKQSSEPPPF